MNATTDGGECGQAGRDVGAGADAILDRLIHNAYRVDLRGDSMRQRKPGVPVDDI
jgi:hypothetical protein